jgi:hypothetical protein
MMPAQVSYLGSMPSLVSYCNHSAIANVCQKLAQSCLKVLCRTSETMYCLELYCLSSHLCHYVHEIIGQRKNM